MLIAARANFSLSKKTFLTLKSCFLHTVDTPSYVEGNIAGDLNNIAFEDAKLRVNITRTGGMALIRASIINAPKRVGSHLRHLLALLPSVYWIGAAETEEAVNGYTLTGGVFNELSQVQFQTGS